MTCDQLEKAASFLNTSGHDISDVFEPASDPLSRSRKAESCIKKSNKIPGLKKLKLVWKSSKNSRSKKAEIGVEIKQKVPL